MDGEVNGGDGFLMLDGTNGIVDLFSAGRFGSGRRCANAVLAIHAGMVDGVRRRAAGSGGRMAMLTLSLVGWRGHSGAERAGTRQPYYCGGLVAVWLARNWWAYVAPPPQPQPWCKQASVVALDGTFVRSSGGEEERGTKTRAKPKTRLMKAWGQLTHIGCGILQLAIQFIHYTIHTVCTYTVEDPFAVALVGPC